MIQLNTIVTTVTTVNNTTTNVFDLTETDCMPELGFDPEVTEIRLTAIQQLERIVANAQRMTLLEQEIIAECNSACMMDYTLVMGAAARSVIESHHVLYAIEMEQDMDWLNQQLPVVVHPLHNLHHHFATATADLFLL